MILYHGSNTKIESIDLNKGRLGKDFGKGFYLTAVKTDAAEMARTAVQRDMCGVPTLNVYDFDETCLTNGDLKVKVFNGYSIEWARFIKANRSNRTNQPVHEYDIVYGPIADDGVVRQMRRYELGDITLKELMKELQYPPKITFQYFFGSEKALEKLRFLC